MQPAVRRFDGTRIPPEIWQEIIAFACTDGGATGRSIALTNRFFYEQSLHARFHSLFFEDTDRLFRFLLSRLHFQHKDCKPHIQHLAIEPSPNNHIPPGRDEYTNAVQTLFSLAAPLLRTLCLVPTTSGAAPFRSFAHPLPRLEELSVWNHPLCPPPAPAAHVHSPRHAPTSSGSPAHAQAQGAVSDADECTGAGVLFPALRRFHYVLTEPSTAFTFKDVLQRLPLLASHQLTHLRLSGLTSADEDVPRILADMLGVPEPMPWRERFTRARAESTGGASRSQSPLDTSKAKFPNLRHVVLYAIQPDKDDMHSFHRWATLLGSLRELERTCKRVVGMRMIVLERSWMRKSRWATRLKDDWLQRMEGGRGCWVESEVEESVIEGPLEAPKGIEW